MRRKWEKVGGRRRVERESEIVCFALLNAACLQLSLSLAMLKFFGKWEKL